ncbi:hypothetical protein YOLOSWAG_169 [Erwinia phage vB_EamM_Yoloswag]|uniref:Uncharacterized protein n=1 Tax=Erwinia phage vB_EamM_Yoloswag TaxID=1958956 RepID=A0A1S6L391_9CAUD|nr:hypothetical protein HOR66_gp169 [Erwinia phage vB_EamM_Yoloswag]AQT28648.1 hypothetical protein YOLOSWAG_169 [Erwinia phage vB_EamM_Yoloswag]
MPLINLNLNTGVASTSATKAQVALAKELFGTKGEAIVKRLEDLHKIKELNTDTKVLPVLDLLKTDSAQVAAFKKTAGGKSTITGVRALVQAKTLVQIVNALRQIKAPRASKTGLKGTATPTARTKTPGKPVVAARTNTQKDLPKVNIASISPKFMNTVSQAQIDSIAAQISEATGLEFAGLPVQNANGQSSPWHFVALNPNGRYVSVSIDPPFHFNEYSSSSDWSVSAETKGGKFAFGSPMRKPTAAALAKEVRAVVGKTSSVINKVKAVDMPKTYKITELRNMTHTQRVTFTKKLAQVLGADSLVYGIDNSGESFKSKPGEEWEIDGHVGTNSLHISFDDPYNGTDKGKWIITPGDGSDSKSFTANDFDGMRAFIHNKKRK